MKISACVLACGLMLAAFTDMVDVVAAPGDDGKRPEVVMQLVGEVEYVDVGSLSTPAGKVVSKRKMVINGKFNEPVVVRTGADRQLTFHRKDKTPIQLNGTIVEEGDHFSEDPKSNSIIKSVGSTRFSGKLDKVGLTIRPSPYGLGDEISLSLATTLSGKSSFVATLPNGKTMPLEMEEGEYMTSTLVVDRDLGPDKRKFSIDWLIVPKLGSKPADRFEQQMYEGMKSHPYLFHIGLVTSPDRKLWKYSGQVTRRDPAKPASDLKWVSTLTLHLHLEKP